MSQTQQRILQLIGRTGTISLDELPGMVYHWSTRSLKALVKRGLIVEYSSGNYSLTHIGCAIMPTILG